MHLDPINLASTATIQQAFEALGGSFGMVVTVLDENKRLRGVVTAGDLRKAILQGNSVETLLSEVMNTSPVVLKISDLGNQDSLDIAEQQLRSQGIEGDVLGDFFAIPLVDSQGMVKGVTSLGVLGPFTAASTNEASRYGSPTALVIGGAGYIGSILVEKLLSVGWSVRVLDTCLYGKASLQDMPNHRNLTVIEGDVCDLSVQVNAVDGVDCVAFLAEIVGDPSCQYIPEVALKTNYLAVNSMAALCSHLNINRFVYASSCSVYGASADPSEYLKESSSLNPVSHYARMKLASENAIFRQMNPLFSPTILRLATVFGLSRRARMDLVVNTFSRDAYLKGEINVFGGDQWRPNVYVGDVADTIVRVLEAPLESVGRKIINVGNEKANHTITELADMAASVFSGTKINIVESVVDQRNYRVSCEKLRAIVGKVPTTSVQDGMHELKEAFHSGMLANLEDERYSNIEALREVFS